MSTNERLQADFLYMKHFAQDYYASKEGFTITKGGFESLHPRWAELMKGEILGRRDTRYRIKRSSSAFYLIATYYSPIL